MEVPTISHGLCKESSCLPCQAPADRCGRSRFGRFGARSGLAALAAQGGGEGSSAGEPRGSRPGGSSEGDQTTDGWRLGDSDLWEIGIGGLLSF